jgi:hypothetical protein
MCNGWLAKSALLVNALGISSVTEAGASSAVAMEGPEEFEDPVNVCATMGAQSIADTSAIHKPFDIG